MLCEQVAVFSTWGLSEKQQRTLLWQALQATGLHQGLQVCLFVSAVVYVTAPFFSASLRAIQRHADLTAVLTGVLLQAPYC